MAEIKISEFCRPLFTQVCDWSTQIEKGVAVDAATASSTMTAMMDQMRVSSRQQPELARQYLMVELPLLFFLDYVMQELMGLDGKWNELAFERNELAGDEKFFDLLEQTLGNPTELATERVAVFYQCMALGFSGTYAPDPQELGRYFRRCALRLGLAPELVETGRVVPDAYKQIDVKGKSRRFNHRRWRWAAIICFGGFVAAYVMNQAIFRNDTIELRRRLDRISVFSNLSPLDGAALAREEARLADEDGDEDVEGAASDVEGYKKDQAAIQQAKQKNAADSKKPSGNTDGQSNDSSAGSGE